MPSILVLTKETTLTQHEMYWIFEKADGCGGSDKINNGSKDLFFRLKEHEVRDAFTKGKKLY